MAEMHFKERDRLTFSIFLALVLHAAVFFLLQLLLANIPPLPKYSGPVYVELAGDETPPSSPQQPEQQPVQEEEPVIKQPEEIPPVNEEPEKEDAGALVAAATLRPSATAKPTSTARKTTTRTVRSTPKQTAQTTNRATQGVTRPPEKTQEKTATAAATPTPTPTEESAFSGDIMSGLNDALKNTATAKSQPTGKPAATRTVSAQGRPGTSSTGGISTNILIEGKKSDRKLERKVEPVLPKIDTDASELTVILTFSVTPDGFLQNIKIVKSNLPTEADNAVVHALTRYKFEPITGTGSVSGEITFNIKVK